MILPLEVKQEVRVSVSWEASSAIALKWNWPGKQTRSLSISPSSAGAELVCVMGFSVVLFVCLFGLEPADTQHGVAAAEGGGSEGRGGEAGTGLS